VAGPPGRPDEVLAKICRVSSREKPASCEHSRMDRPRLRRRTAYFRPWVRLANVPWVKLRFAAISNGA